MRSEAESRATHEGHLPAWHPSALVALILAVALAGTVLSCLGTTIAPPSATRSRVIDAYLPAIIVQWALLLYVTRIGRPRSALGALLGRHWEGSGRALTDMALGVLGALLITLVETAWRALTQGALPAAVSAFLPASRGEHAAWIVVAASAGFCEEVVYRGYLQTELAARTRRPNLGTLLQAALFAVAHSEQGPGAVARSLLYGIALGALARGRKSLLPGIVCHAGVDLAAGFIGH